MKKLSLMIVLLSGYLFAGDINFDTTSIYVPVNRSVPVYKNVKRQEPIQECYNEKVVVRSVDDNSIGVDTVIGGVLGVALGNQIGKGSGRDAAKVIGGISGALIANNLRDGNSNRVKYRKKCNTVYNVYYEKTLKGYKNYFVINGTEYSKFSKRPLDRVKVNINYSW